MRTIRSRAETERPLDPPEVEDANELEEAHELALKVEAWFRLPDLARPVIPVYEIILENFNDKCAAYMMARVMMAVTTKGPLTEELKDIIAAKNDQLILDAVIQYIEGKTNE